MYVDLQLVSLTVVVLLLQDRIMQTKPTKNKICFFIFIGLKFLIVFVFLIEMSSCAIKNTFKNQMTIFSVDVFFGSLNSAITTLTAHNENILARSDLQSIERSKWKTQYT